MIATDVAPAAAAITGQGVGWGLDDNNQLGFAVPADSAHRCTANIACSKTPGAVSGASGLGRMQSVAAGANYRFSIGVDANGDVWSWGGGCDGTWGRGPWGSGGGACGPPSNIDRVHGVGDAGTLGSVTAVAAGAQHALALRSNGTVVAWGYNELGQLGDGTDAEDASCRCRVAPVQVVGPAGTGLLGDGTTTPPITAIAAGGYHSMALDSSGHVWTWGYGNLGQLGDAVATSHDNTCLVRASNPPQRTLNCSMKPVGVKGVGGSGVLAATAISGGSASSYALSNGNVFGWGENGSGQLGNNTTTNSSFPVKVLVGGGAPPPALAGITSIAGGGDFGLAVKGTGSTASVWAWGNNANGQLGNNLTTNRLTAVQVHGLNNAGFLTGIKSVMASLTYQTHSAAYAVTNSGSVWAWGTNSYGELGDNTTTQRKTPVKVKGIGSVNVAALGGIVKVAAGLNYALAYGVPSHLTMTGSASPSPVPRTTLVTYTLTVTGHGPDTPSSVTVSGKVPTGSTFSAAYLDNNTTLKCKNPGVGSTGTNINCSLGSGIANGVSRTVTIKLKATGAVNSHVVYKPTLSGMFLDMNGDNSILIFDTIISAAPPA